MMYRAAKLFELEEILSDIFLYFIKKCWKNRKTEGQQDTVPLLFMTIILSQNIFTSLQVYKATGKHIYLYIWLPVCKIVSIYNYIFISMHVYKSICLQVCMSTKNSIISIISYILEQHSLAKIREKGAKKRGGMVCDIALKRSSCLLKIF